MLVCCPTVDVLQISISWHHSRSYYIAGSVLPELPVLVEAGPEIGEGVRDSGVRLLCLDALLHGAIVGPGLLRLLDTSASSLSLPSVCVLRSCSTETRGDGWGCNDEVSMPGSSDLSCWICISWLSSS